MNDLPDVASNALALVYGDFSIGYTVVDRLGFRVIRDVYTSKPKIKFYTTKRTGGAVTNFQALKIQKLSA
jgi:HK97 family phage major capsid protein